MEKIKFQSKSFLGYKFLLYFSYIIAFLIIPVVAITSHLLHIPVYHLTRDIAAVLGCHPFTGIMSNLGVLIWCITVAICFFTVSIIRFTRENEYTGFLFISGLFTSFLMLDDFFMFHEYVFPKIFHLPEKVFDSLYVMLTVLYLYKYYKVILKNDFLIIFLAYCFFALSMSMDVFFDQKGWEFLFEDGLKLMGIISWFVFFSRVCFTQITSVLAETEPILEEV
ncbi:hypothetical protein [Solitalea lacus]|uniref:hypothetical protein n=1 Tax=Solitalea lacus TaxID=2911172 RepID=UPI001EDAC22A|nr:hypothetical protein [Solitalea lacus]UKJ08325.1 hypothetical protein L2B55_03920 [Solitalea lacus]